MQTIIAFHHSAPTEGLLKNTGLYNYDDDQTILLYIEKGSEIHILNENSQFIIFLFLLHPTACFFLSFRPYTLKRIQPCLRAFEYNQLLFIIIITSGSNSNEEMKLEKFILILKSNKYHSFLDDLNINATSTNRYTHKHTNKNKDIFTHTRITTQISKH